MTASRLHLISIVILTVFLQNCTVTKPDIDSPEQALLSIGDGGGIAGIETQYYVLQNGHVYSRSTLDTTLIRLPSLDRNLVSQCYTNYRTLLTDYHYDQPANTYRFISWQEDGEENRIVWSAEDQEVHSVCKNIYQILYNSIKTNDHEKQ